MFFFTPSISYFPHLTILVDIMFEFFVILEGVLNAYPLHVLGCTHHMFFHPWACRMDLGTSGRGDNVAIFLVLLHIQFVTDFPHLLYVPYQVGIQEGSKQLVFRSNKKPYKLFSSL